MASRIKVAAIVLAVTAYPFLSAFLVHHGWNKLVLMLFAALTVRRAWLAGNPSMRLAYGLLAAFLIVGAAAAEDLAARLIPAFVHLSLALLFGYTLKHPPCLIERMVRLQFPEFKPGITEYLRQLTWLWTGFFAANVVICAALAGFADERTWMVYTGVVVYVLMGILGVGEYLYRPRRFPDLEIPTPMDSLKVMIRNGHKVFAELRG